MIKIIKLINNYKKCSKCKKIKSSEEFYGSDLYCKECRKAQVKEWRIKNYKKYSQKRKERYKKKYSIKRINCFEKREREKYCNKCKQWKFKEKFYKRKDHKDGLDSWCKECCNKYSKKYRQENKEKIKEYRKIHKRDRGENYYQKVIKPWQEKNKEKVYAKDKLKYHIKKGTIQRLPYCQICGDFNNKISGHHFNYSKPLRVIWVCPSCHRQIHLNKLDHSQDIKSIKEILEKEVSHAEAMSSLS